MTVVETRKHIELRLRFSRDEAETLVTASEHHYSPECRPALFQPTRTLKNLLAQGDDPIELIFNWRELDILSKICESPLVPFELSEAVWSAFAEIRKLTGEHV